MIKNNIRTSWVAIAVALLTGVIVLAIFLLTRVNPRSFIQGALGTSLPGSANGFQVTYQNVPDSKVIKMWAKIRIPIEGVKTIVQELRLADVGDVSIEVPLPDQIPEWWKIPSQPQVKHKWMKITESFRPSRLILVWENGELYIFQYGIYGDCSSANNLSGASH